MKKGFTLVELIIVISIIGILVAIAVPKIINATEGASDRKIESEARTIISTTQIFASRTGKLPTKDDEANMGDLLPSQLRNKVSYDKSNPTETGKFSYYIAEEIGVGHNVEYVGECVVLYKGKYKGDITFSGRVLPQ